MATKIQKQIRQQNTNKTFADNLIFLLVSILIIGAPLFRGLFFQKEIMLSNIFAFAIFTVFLLMKGRRKEKLTIFNSPYDYIGLMFIVAYILPILTFQWASLRDAIDILIRYITYYTIYLMVKNLAQDEKYKSYFANVLILSSLVVAMIGVFGAAGYVKLEDVVMGNRISSTFQYPNTLAALMMSIFFLANGYIQQSKRYMEKLMYGTIGFVMLFTFIFTYSRAAWLLFPMFALLYLVFLPNEERIASILYFIAVFAPNALVLQPFTSQLTIEAEMKPRALLVFVAGVGMFIVLYSIIVLIQSKLQEKYYKAIYGLLGVAVVAAGVFAYLALNTTEPLVFSNMEITENRTNQIQRTVDSIEKNQYYILKINVNGKTQSEDEKHWPWRIRIDTVNEAGEQELLLEQLGEKDVNGDIEIPFTTLETTKNLNIYFTNTYPKTEVVFNTAEVVDIEKSLVQNIKLKYKYIPESLIARFSSIDLKEDNVGGGRLAFYKDSFSIFKAKPLFGSGGGAWKSLYSKYQSLPYNSTEAHNYMLQTMVETGLVGVGILTILVAVLGIHVLRAFRNKDMLTISLLFAILALMGHSLLDFNFSFHYIPMVFWILIALLEKESFKAQTLPIKKINFGGKKVGTKVFFICGLLMTLWSTGLYGAYAISVKNAETVNTKPLDESIRSMKMAAILDPFLPEIRIDLYRMQKVYALEKAEYELLNDAQNHLIKAEKYAPYSPTVLQEIIGHYISFGEFEEAFKFLDILQESAPLKSFVYEAKANAYDNVAEYYINGIGEVEQGVGVYKGHMLKIIDEVREANEKTTKPIQLSQKTLQAIFRAKYFSDNYKSVEKLKQHKGIVYISYLDLEGAGGFERTWRFWNSEGGQINIEFTEEGLKVNNNGENLGIVYSQFFSLNPCTDYEVEVVFDEQSTERTLRSYIISNTGKSIQIATNIELDNIVDGMYRYSFTTSDDIEPDKQYIRFDHAGKSKGTFTIKSIIIRELN